MSTGERIEVGLSEAPVVTLSNGLRVANFSSGHSFAFVDGSVLKPCQDDRVEALSMDRRDKQTPSKRLVDAQNVSLDVSVSFRLTPTVIREMDKLLKSGAVDIVLCPLPVIAAPHDVELHCGSVLGLIEIGG